MLLTVGIMLIKWTWIFHRLNGSVDHNSY
jgi:hypothetical protein